MAPTRASTRATARPKSRAPDGAGGEEAERQPGTTSSKPSEPAPEDSDPSGSESKSSSTTTTPSSDPIIKTYDVYIKHALSSRLFAFQYPNKEPGKSYTNAGGQGKAPIEIRMKPTAGIIELDIPLDPTESYNPKTGRKWGAAAELIKDEGKIDAFGLAGGYTTSFPTRPRPRRPASARHSSTRAQSSTRTNETSDHDMDAALSSSSSSESEAKPEPELKKISLAGKLEAPDDTSVQYMAGVFRAARFTGSNDELHLNPIHSIVQLVPQLYHVDALDAANALSAQSAAQRTKSQAEQKPSQQQQKQQNASSAPQAVQMTAKILSNEGYDMQEVQKWLRAAQEEPWRRTAFYDEETLEAWHRYTKLFLDDDDDDDKEGSSSSGGGDGSGAVRRGRPELRSTMSDRQWLYSICPKKPADYAEVFADLVTQKKDREGEEGGGGGGLRKAGVLKVGSGSSTVSPATAKGKGKAKA